MAPRARTSSARPAYDALEADAQDGHGELSPGERIGPPLRRPGGKALLRGLIILSAFGGGWVLLGGPTMWPEWLPSEIANLYAAMERRAAGSAEPVTSAMTTTPPPAGQSTKPALREPLPASPQAGTSGNAAIAPDAGALPLAAAVKTALLAPAPARVDEPPAEPLPPPAVDPADPYQARAVAVGLHPDLSRVLLERLSPSDYRNAGIAIQTALAETPDRGVFVWPRQRPPELALYQVRFVPGAAPSCRRYVVTITKDGWLTTAPPMEKCGLQPGRQRRE
jgi:hypothetical protein